MNLIDKTDQYAQNIRNTYDEIKIFENKIKNFNPANVRKNYDKYWDLVNKKEIETNEEKEDLDESIHNLEDGKELLEKIGNSIQNIKKILNSFQVGTLQGITNQSFDENNLMVDENDEIAQNVLDEPYNELNDINRNTNRSGGKRNYKSKKYKANKYKNKTNKNKTNKNKSKK